MGMLDGKTAIVTGGARGIGLAIAKRFVAEGARVVIGDIDETAGKAAAASLGSAARFVRTDVGAAGDARNVVAEACGVSGDLDILVNNAGIIHTADFLDIAEADFDRVLRVNLKGTFNTLRAAGRVMTAQGSGSIVIFSSIRSLVVEPGQSVYACTKAGIVQLVRGAAVEFGTSGVRVNAVGPGVVETPLTAPIKANADWYNAYANKSILKRWATPDEMAGPTLFLISDAASFGPGTILFADGGWLAADGRFTPPGM